MKRIFESEKGTDLLINEYVKQTGIKIGKLLNNSVYSFFLPEAQTLYIEAAFLLQMEDEGNLNQWTIKQSISRGITWLSKYPVENCAILRSILLHFTCAPYLEQQGDERNDYVKEMFTIAEKRIKEIDANYLPIHACLGNFGEDICDHWSDVWNERIMYDVISSIVFIQNPQKPFTCFDAISILKEIENVAKEKYSVK